MLHQFLTGKAGTGKSTLVRQRVEADPRYGMLVASTGIAGVNLGTGTINSVLKYYNTESLLRKYRSGKLREALYSLRDNGALGRHLIIDEISMVPAEQLTILARAIDEVFRGNVSIIAVGDFAQLPPVEGEFAFRSEEWPEFEDNMLKLSLVHRQHDPNFLAALNAMRSGDKASAQLLADAGANFRASADPNFKGITLVPTNDEANAINGRKLAELRTSAQMYVAKKTGAPSADWKQLPEVILIKQGSRVMITANDQMRDYANGDLGIVLEARPESVTIQLDRNGEEVVIPWITRKNIDYTNGPPVCRGTISFMPLKLGDALTVHKCQGLTLPAIQFNVTHWFAGEPALCYVAISRTREASNVTIVGDVDKLAQRIKAHPEVEKWI